MKKVLFPLIALVLALGLSLPMATPVAAHMEDCPMVVTLYAGQTIDVGTVEVWNDATNLYVKYQTTGDWVMTETHLAVATSLEGIPQTQATGKGKNIGGNPIPGQFPYIHEDLGGVTEDTYTIPLSEDWENACALYIAAQAEVMRVSGELVANGGFETPTVGGSWAVFASGTPGLAWTVEPTTPPWDEGVPQGVELQRNFNSWLPDSGSQYAELDAYDPVRISQDLSTWPEGLCTLTYAWSPRPGHNDNVIQVWWDGELIATNELDGTENSDTAWTPENFPDLVPDPSGTTRLEFVETGENDQLGMFLDSVSVVCVQEETAWAGTGVGELPFRGKNWATYFTYRVQWETVLTLENKDSDWSIMEDGTWGELSYKPSGSEFVFRFYAEGLEAYTEYSLIYYADFEDRFTYWGGNNPGALIATMTTDGSGNVCIPGSEELNMDLPDPSDANSYFHYYSGAPDFYAHDQGAKIWLVPSELYDDSAKKVTSWQPTRFLFETDLITYTYTP